MMRPPKPLGFTLVEMLVSMAVLIMLIVMVAQLMNGATSATTTSRKRLDADAQARVIFDRMAADFNKMLLRKDLDYVSIKVKGNDSLFFFSEAPGFFSSTTTGGQSPVSLVGYRIHSNPDPNGSANLVPQLERLGKALSWSGTQSSTGPGSPMFIAYSGSFSGVNSGSNQMNVLRTFWPKTIPTNDGTYTDDTDQDFQAIGDQVCRMEIAYLLTTGTVSNFPIIGDPKTVATSSQPSNMVAGQRWYDTTNSRAYAGALSPSGSIDPYPIGLQDVSAIIVALVILDSDTQKIVKDPSKITALFRDPTDEPDFKTTSTAPQPKLMAQTWLEALNAKLQETGASDGIPKAAASQIRIYQRTFYLNKTPI